MIDIANLFNLLATKQDPRQVFAPPAPITTPPIMPDSRPETITPTYGQVQGQVAPRQMPTLIEAQPQAQSQPHKGGFSTGNILQALLGSSFGQK
jgi:hypothetical protein